MNSMEQEKSNIKKHIQSKSSSESYQFKEKKQRHTTSSYMTSILNIVLLENMIAYL